MSSILEALRKVEAEKAKRKVDLGEVEEVLAERDLLVPEEEEPRGRSPTLRRALIGVAVVALAGAFGVAAFFLHNLLTGTSPEQVTESQAPFRAPADLPQAAVQIPEPLTTGETPARPAGPARVSTNGPTITPPGADQATAVPPEPEAVEVKAPVQTAPPTAVSPTVTATPPTEQASAVATVKPAPQRPKLKINILRPSSEEFPTPLAVVNRKKVGVGDYVDGAQVIEIQNDGIVFEYGDDLFLVKF